MKRDNKIEDANTTSDRASSSAFCVEDMLSELMSALATGARAVQGLPMGDDFDYQSSFPEFQLLLDDSQESLLEVLLITLDDAISNLNASSNNNDYEQIDFENLDDPLLWETCKDVYDALLEQAESSTSSNSSDLSPSQTGKFARGLKSRAQSSFGRLLDGIVDMEKPQIVYKFGPGSKTKKSMDSEDTDIDIIETINTGHRNGRTEVFVPPFLTKKYHCKGKLPKLDDPEWKKEGHGVETKLGEMKPVRVSPNVIAPSHHYQHPYKEELQEIDYPAWQLEISSIKPSKIPKADDSLTSKSRWVDTPEGLAELKKILESNESPVREIAVDLEAHSYRSFSGMICLIQISIKDGKDFLIDPFPVWDLIHETLALTLANPNVVKVFHGADSDIAWLQRDFGLYVVNLFDTGRAARALRFPSAGFAYLLEYYVDDVKADKSHQLSDWRQRPLPAAMKEYAIMDTHYLLDIYHAMKYDLAQKKETSVEKVLDESRRVCTIRYTPEVFRLEGYRSLTQRRGHKTLLNSRQEDVLRKLWDWRDQVARECDESIAFVCNNMQLMRLAMACPVNLSTLQGLLQPMPILLIQNSKEVLTIIQKCLHSHRHQVSSPKQHQNQDRPSSAYFKPANPDDDEEEENNTLRHPSRSLMSPVLGTEALYREAGWISPTQELYSKGASGDGIVEDILTTSATDDDSDSDGDETKNSSKEKSKRRKPKRGLVVHKANYKFQSTQYTQHSMQMGSVVASIDTPASSKGNHTETQSDLIDGFGPARVAHVTSEDMEEAIKLAKSNAAQIRTTQEHCHIIGLLSSGTELPDEEDDSGDLNGNDEDEDRENGKATEQEEFVIPRSMREIYRISNRNRRNKKSSSPLPQEQNEEELKELEKAESILKLRSSEGKKYIDMIPNSPKRQRTKSTGAASLSSSEDPALQDSGSVTREDDIALMQEVGWIEGKEEIDNMLKQRHENDRDEDESSEDGAKRGETPKPFDYSSVGPIGAFNPTTSTNPFFSGAALSGGHLTQQTGKLERKKTSTVARGGKQGRRQVERPDKRGGRSQAYKKG